jgi:hypothetical protein
MGRPPAVRSPAFSLPATSGRERLGSFAGVMPLQKITAAHERILTPNVLYSFVIDLA